MRLSGDECGRKGLYTFSLPSLYGRLIDVGMYVNIHFI